LRPLVVLPTYNEAENLVRLLEALRALPVSLKTVVVDDASPDGTGRLADELARGCDDLRVIHRGGPRGFGEAQTEGFRAALEEGAAVVVTMDCDFSHNPCVVPRLLEALEAADLVIGSRYVEGGQLRGWPPHRRLLSAAANAFVRAMFGLRARDCTSGFRGYRREVLEGIPWEGLHSPGYSFLVEVLYWASRREGLRIREVPIVFTERRLGTSKMGLREIVLGAANLMKLRLRLWRG
jgi:dolichol-phosphate mannosyltransferase